MKKAINIQVGDRTYPFRMTLGAMLRFKRATEKEVTDLDDHNIEEVATLLYACLASASAADKVPFNVSFDEFCDLVSVEDIEAMQTLLVAPEDFVSEGASGPEEEKKS